MADITAMQDEIAQDEVGSPVPIYKKNGEPYLAADGTTQSTITVLGSDAKQVRLAKETIQRKLLRQRRTKLEPSDILENRISVAAAAVTAWDGWESEGKPFACTPEHVKLVLKAEHILEQVEAGIAGHADFFTS